MTGKELLFRTLRHEAVPRAPWVPFAGVHAGALIGADAEQLLTDGDTLVRALLEVNRLYKPDGQPVVFDLQLEAEILGCELVWARDCPPSVASHPLADAPEVPDAGALPTAERGRLPMVLSAMRRMKEAVGETTALYGLLCGPFTLASHLRGNDIFMDMFDDEGYVRELLTFCTACAKRMADLFLGAGMDVIAVVDPLVSQIAPESFDAMLAESFKAVFDYIRSRGAFSSFFVCGNATPQLEVMCKTYPDSIAVDENVDFVYGKSISDKYNIAISGNIPLTTVMLHGTPKDNMKFVVELLDKVEDHRNMIVSPGCDMPYDVPVENTVACSQAVKNTDQCREMIKDYTGPDDSGIRIELPDYEHLKKPFIEVFTLDSVQCAACTYMMAAAKAAKEYFGDKIDIIEYKYTVRENVVRCKKMGITNLPTMCINGQIKHVSMIPDSEALRAEIEALL